MLRHLTSRGLHPENYQSVVVDEQEGVVTFLLFDFSGAITGYQRYKPGAPKKLASERNSAELKYFIHATSGRFAVFGLESVLSKKEPVFVTEGVFEAASLHSKGAQAIAILGVTQFRLVPQIWLMKAAGYRFVACIQSGKAGRQMLDIVKPAPEDIEWLPEGMDVDDLDDEQLEELICTHRTSLP